MQRFAEPIGDAKMTNNKSARSGGVASLPQLFAQPARTPRFLVSTPKPQHDQSAWWATHTATTKKNSQNGRIRKEELEITPEEGEGERERRRREKHSYAERGKKGRDL